MFTYYFNDFVYILICQPVGRPVDLYILFSNFTYISIFAHYLVILPIFCVLTTMSTCQPVDVDWVDRSMTDMQFYITQQYPAAKVQQMAKKLGSSKVTAKHIKQHTSNMQGAA